MPLILSGDTGISGVDGTAGTPSLQGTDSNTGVFYATDIVGIATGGSERMRIDSAGQVGVGVTPNTWSTGRVIEVGVSGTSLWGLSSGTSYVTAGYYFNSTDKFALTGNYAIFSQLVPSDGSFRWRASTATGTAGNNATMETNLTLTQGGTLVLKNGNTAATGIGITFPATQSASSDANTLDDYEEGTWTPAFTNLTINSGTPTYSGTYTKIGRLVYVTWSMSGTKNVTITADSTRINNLPFDSGANGWGPWGTTGSLTTFYGSITSGVNLYFTNTLSSTTENLSGSIVYIV